jgi:uncharacterized repeat protein (TIGR01451 family)
MKPIMRKKLLLIIVVAVLAVSIPVALALIHRGQQPQQPSNGGTADVPTDNPSTNATLAILSEAQGSVSVMKAGTGGWTEAHVPMSLHFGDTVRSGNSSSAKITFFDGSIIELEADTELEVVSIGISGIGSTTINLKQSIGTTISRVNKLVDSASSYEIETPAGVAVVRGSVMIVRVTEECATWITNQRGNVWGIAQGVELQIPLGRVCIIICGEPPRLVPLPNYGGGGGGGGGGSGSSRTLTDLALGKSGSPDAVDPGGQIIYTLQITNNGPSISTGAVVLDALPSSVSFVSATNGGIYDSGSHTVRWVIGGLARGASTSVSVIVKADESASEVTVTNTAMVAANERDSYRGNDTGTEHTAINTEILNNPPVAENDVAATDEDNPVTVAAPGVLNNDFDPDIGDTLTVIAVDTSGTRGAVTAWHSTGSFTYDPNGQFEYLQAGSSTTDSFSYTVSDGNGGIDTATVTITIHGANDAPTNISLDNSSIAENQPPGTAVGSFSTSDTDMGDTFTYTLVSGTGDNDNASFTIVGSQLRTAASFDYETKISCSIRVRVTDSGGLHYEKAFTIIIISANNPPVAENDVAATDEDNPVTVAAPGVLNNDFDPDIGDTLTVIAVDTSGTRGVVTAWHSTGSFTYDPNGQFEYLQAGSSTTDSFSYTVSDGNGGIDTATVTITIHGANDAPTNISLDNSSIAENQPPGTAVGSFSTTDTDMGDTFTYTLVSGTGDNDNASFTIVGSQLRTAASFDYETKSSCSIRVRVTDSGGLHYEKAFTIIIISANNPPVSENDVAATDEDNPVTVAAPGVLNNDFDPDIGDTLTVIAVDTSGTKGAVTAWHSTGSFTYDPNGQFEYLQAGSSTTDSFSYTVSDGNGGIDTATVTITIHGANDAPTNISLDNSSIAENQPPGTAVGSFSTTDTDTGDTFSYTLVSGTGDNDNASFTIVGSQLRTAASFDYETKSSCSIRVRVTDSGGLHYEKAFTIIIISANNPPVAVDDSATTAENTPVTVDVLDNDFDLDGDTLTVVSVTQGAHGSVINNGGDITYAPDHGFSGTDSFIYTISDGKGGTDTATVTITVTTTNTLTRLNVQIDTGPTASIYIWDDTAGSWAMDEVAQKPVDGTNHVTSAIITVAGGHHYYVWVKAAGVTYYVKNCPKDWTIEFAPVGDDDAAYGYAAPNRLYPIHFTAE